jgi:hypothetical protein
MRMKRFMNLGVALTLALAGTSLLATSARAETGPTIDFEAPTYATGSIAGQDGWSSPINPAYDQEVDSSAGVTGFGAQSFRMSNAVSSGSFGDWPYSRPLINEAGETSAQNGGISGGTRQSHFEASFDFASAVPGAEQPGLGLGVSPDRGDGARMSLLRIRDESTGLLVSFADYQSGANEVGCGPTSANFVNTVVASGLDRSVDHSIRIAMDFVNGTENDVVSVYVDGVLVHVGTSWEDYFRECESNPTRTVDSLLFRASGTAAATLGAGFLIDDLTLSSSASTWSSPCVITTSPSTPTVYTLQADCTTDHTILVPQNAGGSVFDGNGFTITGVDPVGGHFLGAVVQGAAGVNPITVENLTVRVSALADVCDGGDNRLRGILFDSVGGTITNNDVINLRQGSNSGCQEGNAIEVRNAPFEKGNAPNTTVLITANTATGYQKTGVLVNGSVAATIRSNTVVGAGPINYIAQNGIQVGFGATVTVRMNSSSRNNYTPKSFVACGFLIFEADGVNASNNTWFSNEKNQCNFGKGGGTFKPAL